MAFISLLGWLRAVEMKKQQRKLVLEREKLHQECQVNEQLRRVDALKDQFLANTSHELRTPLHGIIGLSESLLDQEPDAAKKEDLSMIAASGKRLASLVNDLLDFSKLKNFDIELQRKPIDLRSLTDVVLKVMQPLVAGKNLRLENAIPAYLPPPVATKTACCKSCTISWAMP